MNHPKVQELLLNDEENLEVDEIFPLLSSLDSLTLELQSDRTTLLDAHNLSDGLIQKYLRLIILLSTSLEIVKNERFEFLVSKIHDGKENSLTIPEQRSVSHFLKKRNE